jgi:peptidylprolyl isomerase
MKPKLKAIHHINFIVTLILILMLICGCGDTNNISTQPIDSQTSIIINSSVKGEDVRVVKNGDVIKVDYTGTLSDGSTFDSSIGREPLEFTVGAGQMIEGFDKAVVGMKTGETRKVTIPAKEAYGEHRSDMVLVINKGQLPKGMSPKIGDHLMMSQPNGRSIEVVVSAFDESTITVDANHFLAGKDLTFEITLVTIK